MAWKNLTLHIGPSFQLIVCLLINCKLCPRVTHNMTDCSLLLQVKRVYEQASLFLAVTLLHKPPFQIGFLPGSLVSTH